MKRFKYIQYGLLAGLALLAGCVAVAPEPKVVPKEFASKYQGKDIAAVISNSQQMFQKAKEDDIYIYSPNNFEQAKGNLRKARALIGDQTRHDEVLEALYYTDYFLEQGYKVKDIMLREMHDVFDLRSSLQAKEAYKSHPIEYRGFQTRLYNMSENVEKNMEAIFQDPSKKASFDKDKESLKQDMLAMELVIIKFNALDYGKNVLAQAESNGAEKLAPKTYQEAKLALSRADAYIDKNRYDEEGIAREGNNFLFSAQHTLQVTKEINMLQQMEKGAYEDFVLTWEDRMGRVASGLKMEDQRDKSLDGQAAMLQRETAKLVKENSDQKKQIERLTAERDKAQQDLQTAREISSLEQQIEELDSKIATWKGPKQRLQEDLQAIKQQAKSVDTKKQQLRSEHDVLQNLVSGLQSKLGIETEPKTETAGEVKGESNTVAPAVKNPEQAQAGKDASSPSNGKQAVPAAASGETSKTNKSATAAGGTQPAGNAKPTVVQTQKPAPATKAAAPTPNKTPTAAANQTPTTTSNKEPSAATNKEPSTTSNKQPSAASNKEPSAASNQEPAATSTVSNKTPSAESSKPSSSETAKATAPAAGPAAKVKDASAAEKSAAPQPASGTVQSAPSTQAPADAAKSATTQTKTTTSAAQPSADTTKETSSNAAAGTAANQEAPTGVSEQTATPSTQ